MSVPRPQFHRSATLKLLVIGFLALLMAIPLSMLDGSRHDRQERLAVARVQVPVVGAGDGEGLGGGGGDLRSHALDCPIVQNAI